MAAAGVTDLTCIGRFGEDEQSEITAISQVECVSNTVNDKDQNLVCFAENDLDNPVNWSGWRKWPIVVAVSLMSMIR